MPTETPTAISAGTMSMPVSACGAVRKNHETEATVITRPTSRMMRRSPTRSERCPPTAMKPAASTPVARTIPKMKDSGSSSTARK